MVYLVSLAYLADLVVGDPMRPTHPVILQGRLISFCERKLNRVNHIPSVAKLLGALTVLITVSSGFVLTWLATFLFTKIHPTLGFLSAVWLTSTTIAQKGLAQCTEPIVKALKEGDLPLARKLTGEIVGRDTTNLEEHELVRAAIETVAENTVDAITAPLFFALIGGAPLAMAYRTINTLDSMLGYKSERYLHFGWAAARLDDVVNYIPARLSGLVLLLAVRLCGLNVKGARRTIKRDAKLHPSPNSGIMEGGFAGALDLTLGGVNYYQGQESFRALMGDVQRPLVPADIKAAVRLMKTLSLLFFLISLVFLVMWGGFR